MSKRQSVGVTVAEGKIIAEVSDGDGHSIIPATEYIKAGVNEAFVRSLETTYESSTSDPKWAITTSKGPVAKLKGVYTLDILRAAVNHLKLANDAGAYFGRGRQARAYTAALMSAK